MKKIFFYSASLVFFIGFFNQILVSEETPPKAVATEVAPPPTAPATPAVAPAAETASQAQTAVVAPPAAPMAAPAAAPVSQENPVVPPASEPTAGAPAAPAVSPVEPPKSETAQPKTESVGFVEPLSELVRFYEDEVASAKKLIERWNERVRTYLEREKGLAAQKDKFDKTLSEKQAQDPKGNKREISNLKKQLKSLEKDLKTVRRDIDKLRKDLMAELKEMGNYAGKTIADKFNSVKEKVKAFGLAEQ